MTYCKEENGDKTYEILNLKTSVNHSSSVWSHAYFVIDIYISVPHRMLSWTYKRPSELARHKPRALHSSPLSPAVSSLCPGARMSRDTRGHYSHHCHYHHHHHDQCMVGCEGRPDVSQCQFECEMTLGLNNEVFITLLRCMAEWVLILNYKRLCPCVCKSVSL